MSIETAEKLKAQLTDKYVVVKHGVAELKRFESLTGVVKTVNMSGRALVQFDGPVDISWYDIDPQYLSVVEAPAKKAAADKHAPTKEAAGKATPAVPAAAKPAAAKPAGMSPLEAARAQGAAGSKAPAAKAQRQRRQPRRPREQNCRPWNSPVSKVRSKPAVQLRPPRRPLRRRTRRARRVPESRRSFYCGTGGQENVAARNRTHARGGKRRLPDSARTACDRAGCDCPRSGACGGCSCNPNPTARRRARQWKKALAPGTRPPAGSFQRQRLTHGVGALLGPVVASSRRTPTGRLACGWSPSPATASNRRRHSRNGHCHRKARCSRSRCARSNRLGN